MTNKFTHSEPKNRVGVIIRAGAIIGTNTVKRIDCLMLFPLTFLLLLCKQNAGFLWLKWTIMDNPSYCVMFLNYMIQQAVLLCRHHSCQHTLVTSQFLNVQKTLQSHVKFHSNTPPIPPTSCSCTIFPDWVTGLIQWVHWSGALD